MATRDSETTDDHLYAERYLSSENRFVKHPHLPKRYSLINETL